MSVPASRRPPPPARRELPPARTTTSSPATQPSAQRAPVGAAHARVGNAAVARLASAQGPVLPDVAGMHAAFGNAAVVRTVAPPARSTQANAVPAATPSPTAAPPATPSATPAPAAMPSATPAPVPPPSPSTVPAMAAAEEVGGEARVARAAAEKATAAPPARVAVAAGARARGGAPAAAEPRGGARKQTAAPDEGAAPAAGARGGGDADAPLQELADTPASRALAGVGTARSGAVRELDRERAALAAHPPSLDRPSGLPRRGEPARRDEGLAAPATGRARPGAPPPGGSPPAVAATHVAATGPLPAPSPRAEHALDSAADDSPTLARQAAATLQSLPVDDEAVDTDAGPAPAVSLAGDADPGQLDDAAAAQRERIDDKWSGARADMAADEGENDIFPTVPHERLRARVGRGRGGGAGPARAPRAGDYTAEERAAFDAGAGAQWQAAVADAQAKDDAARRDRHSDEDRAHAETNAEVARLTREATRDQKAEQAEAKAGVAGARRDWMKELHGAGTRYDQESARLDQETRAKIDHTRDQADGDAQQKLVEAHDQAETKKREAESEAAEEKRKKQEESKGFFGWLKSSIKSFIAKVKAAVQFIFDKLRKAVKALIEAAKRAAVWLIEQARKAIVGFIHAFGALLLAAADLFLAAFPRLRAKAKALIRRGIDAAERGVNRAAEWLKAGVCKALDLLGEALDFILSVYEKVYLAILDAVELIAVGIIEILEGIARLARSARMMPDFFLGQIEEEFLGQDFTQPLAIERTRPREAKTVVQSALAGGEISHGDASLLGKTKLDSNDVEVEGGPARMSLSPELLASLPPLKDGGEYHPPQSLPDEDPNQPIATQAATPPEPTAATGAPAKGAVDVADMTPEQQLDYLEKEEVPHTCQSQKTEEPAKESDVPEAMKIYGPFSGSQRAHFMWIKMKQGIKNWWDCNKVKVIAIFVVAALVTLLLGILTGGAIFAAIPPLLEIIGTVLIGLAMIKAADYIGSYLSKAWGGDLKGGAKALARGLGILAIELVFALLFNIGAVMKSLKSGLKGAGEAAARAAKNVVVDTVKAGRKFVGATVGAVRAGIKNSRLIIKGFRAGFGEGVRTIGQLTRELLAKVRIRGFFFKLRKRWLELWIVINPAKKVAEVEIDPAQLGQTAVKTGSKEAAEAIEGLARQLGMTKDEVETALDAIRRSGEKLPDDVREAGEKLTKRLAVLEGKAIPQQLEDDLRAFMKQFGSQSFKDNKLLQEIWDRALRKAAESNEELGRMFKDGVLTEEALANAAAMHKLYSRARRKVNDALEEVVLELEESLGPLENRILKLPENVQVHHLLYKAWFPTLSVTKNNLILALRKIGESLDELHDLLHLVSSAGENRFNNIIGQMSDLLKRIYDIR